MTLLPDLSQRLAEAAVKHGVPGAVIAVGYGDEFAEAATGVLNLNTGVEATPDSLFQIGSVTKVWTATLVLQLVDEGLVDLDQPVRRYLRVARRVHEPGALFSYCITAERVDGRHLVVTFVDGGRYLHNGRAFARVKE